VLSRQQLYASVERMRQARQPTQGLDAWLALARASRAEAVLTGGFARLGEKIRIGFELHNAHTGQMLAAESLIADKPEQILSEVDLVCLKLASRLGAEPQRNAQPANRAPALTTNLEAYRYYSQGVEKAQDLHNAEAIALFERAIALDPQFAMAHARIGYTYTVTSSMPPKGKPYLEKAFALANRLTEMDRAQIAAWYALASQDYPAAVRAYEAMIAAYPQETELYVRLGRLLRGEERYDEAVAAINKGLVLDRNNPALHNLLGSIYSQLGRHAEAIAAERQYVALAPGEPNAYDSLGLAYLWAGRLAEAESALEQALRIQPGFQPAVIHLGNLLYRTGRFQQALGRYREYVAGAPSDLDKMRGYSAMARLHWRMRDFAAAAKDAEDEERCLPNHAEMSMVLAFQRGDRQPGEKSRRLWMGDWPVDDRGSRLQGRYRDYWVAQALLAGGDRDEAIRACRDALRHWTHWGDTDTGEDCLADAYAAAGRADEAIAEYWRALRLYPGEALARYHLAVALARKGMVQESRAELTGFLRMWAKADGNIPELLDAKRRLGGH
jgi:tetratricopeptide (TPR) repeat protein